MAGFFSSVWNTLTGRGKESQSMQFMRETGAGQGDIRVARAALIDAVNAACIELDIVLKPGGTQVIEKAILEAVDPGSIQNLQLLQRMRSMGVLNTGMMMQSPTPAMDPTMIAQIVNQVMDAREAAKLTQTDRPQKSDEV